MIKSLVDFSLRFRGVVILLSLVLMGYGIYVALNAKQDVFPDFVPPQAVVQTEAPGLTPEQVEQLVTRPIESAMNGLGNLETLRSDSVQGLSVITAIFKEGTNIFLARQNLAERLAEVAGELPAGVKTPKMEPLTSSTMDLLKIGITSETRSAMELRAFADWTLKPRILSVPGVATCSVFGGEARELQIQVIPAKLQTYGLSVEDVLNAARSAVGVRGGGFIDTENQRMAIQTEMPSLTAKSLGEIVIDTEGDHSVRLEDAAKVVDAPRMPTGDAIIDGEPGVLLTMLSQYGANTKEVSDDLEGMLDGMVKNGDFEREEIDYHPALHRPASFITSSLHNIEHSLLLGGILVTIILFVFLMNVRTALISLLAIPFSLLTAIIVMDKLGFTLNTITLGGLTIAIGAVVDDAIIDVENIYRRLRENQLKTTPRSRLAVVLDASLEVRTAVVYATFVIILVFIPVLTMTGLQGKFFAPLAWAYIIAILASLVVALTLTPALTLTLFSRGEVKAHDPWFQSVLKSIYRTLLSPLLRHAWVMMGLVVVMTLIVLASMFAFEPQAYPDFREGHFVVGVSMAPGTSLEEMRRMGTLISREIKKLPNVKTVENQIGRAELGEDTFGPETGEFHINLEEDVSAANQQKTLDQLTDLLKQIPGIQPPEITTFLGDRIHESVTGEKAPIVINIFGNNLDDIEGTAKDVADAVSSIPGHGDVAVQAPPKGPQVFVRLRPEKLLQFSFRPADVFDAVEVAFSGEVVGQDYQGDRVADVVVILDPAARRFPEQVGDLIVQNAQGVRLPLHQLADVYQDVARTTISHENAQRRVVVTVDPDESVDLASFQAKAEAKVAKIDVPDGVLAPVFSGDVAAAAKSTQELILHSVIAAAGILVLLAIVFGNVRNLVLLLINLPFALVGGVVAVIVAGHSVQFDGIGALFKNPFGALHLGTLSIGEMVGFVTLFGITTRNSIMLISHFEHLVKAEGMSWNRETALRGASERLVPILMTALVTALGLLPLALGSGEAGREIEGPMAIVILGGLASSTILNLLVMPTLALRFGRFAGGLHHGSNDASKPATAPVAVTSH